MVGKMSAFSGKYYYTVDPKGRVMVPAPFREIIAANYGARLYVTNDAFDKCLQIYPLEEWNILQGKVRGLPQMNDAVSYFMRKVIASAIEVEMDKQGRVLLPLAHRQDMGIDSEAVIVGVINKIEVWDKATWDEVMDRSRVDSAAYKKALGDFGL
jgi:MraZ protein